MEFLMNTSKRCCRCGTHKSSADFSKNISRRDGLQDTCKECVRKYTRKGYQTKEMTYTTRKRYMEDWAVFFEQEYGSGPYCHVCQTLLSYRGQDDLPTVAFDHRYGNHEPIKGSPSAFCRTHPCIDEHKETWRLCDFGILCRQCNAALPTFDRERWLNRAIAYMSEVLVS